MKSKRIIARVTQQTANKLKQLTQIKQCTTTDAITLSIDAFYSSCSKAKKSCADIFEDNHLIGSLHSDKSLSENYKSHLTSILKKKL